MFFLPSSSSSRRFSISLLQRDFLAWSLGAFFSFSSWVDSVENAGWPENLVDFTGFLAEESTVTTLRSASFGCWGESSTVAKPTVFLVLVPDAWQEKIHQLNENISILSLIISGISCWQYKVQQERYKHHSVNDLHCRKKIFYISFKQQNQPLPAFSGTWPSSWMYRQ